MVALSLLTQGTGGSSTSYNTASVTPTGNALLVLHVSYGITATAVAPSSISGLGLTWVLVESVNIPNNNVGSALYRAQGASPGSGAITIAFAAAPSNLTYRLFQATDVPIGNNGADAVGSSGNVAIANANASFTLSPSPAGSSTILSTIAYNAGTANVMTPGSGYTKIGTDGDAPSTPSHQSSSAYRDTGSSTVDWTTTNASGKSVLGMEIKHQVWATGGTSWSRSHQVRIGV